MFIQDQDNNKFLTDQDKNRILSEVGRRELSTIRSLLPCVPEECRFCVNRGFRIMFNSSVEYSGSTKIDEEVVLQFDAVDLPDVQLQKFCHRCDYKPKQQGMCARRIWFTELQRHLASIDTSKGQTGHYEELIPQYAALIEMKEDQERIDQIERINNQPMVKKQPFKLGTLIANTLYGDFADALKLIQHFPEAEYLTWPESLKQKLDEVQEFEVRAIREADQGDTRREAVLKMYGPKNSPDGTKSEILIQVSALHKAFFKKPDGSQDDIKSGHVLRIRHCIEKHNEGTSEDQVVTDPFGGFNRPKEIAEYLVGQVYGVSQQSVRNYPTR